jgi:hypothetical protein
MGLSELQRAIATERVTLTLGYGIHDSEFSLVDHVYAIPEDGDLGPIEDRRYFVRLTQVGEQGLEENTYEIKLEKVDDDHNPVEVTPPTDAGG